jgi:hypothetical protein
MAKQQNLEQNKTNTFIKGLNKDSDPSFVQEGMWTHARNASNNTFEGDLGTLSNEPSNIFCTQAGETLPGTKHIIGAIHLYSDKWILFTAAHGNNDLGNTVGSEIGLFEQDLCIYRPIVQDICLGFSKWHLITGAAREKEDCTWQVYWSDGNNPDRYLNIGDPQTWPPSDYVWQGNNTYADPDGNVLQWPGVTWIQDCDVINNCEFCTDTTELDCDKIRLARLMETPCLHVSSGEAGGNLRNGSYFATIAYAIKGQKVTDWFSPSNVQPLWFDNEPSGALEIDIAADSENFDEFILVVVANINQQAVAKQIGIYSTNTSRIYLDQIKEDLISVPVEQLPIQTPVYERADQMLEVNNYLLRVGPTSKFDFNYQPLANLITSNWVSVEYPGDYYIKGGYKPSYLRDEVYAFFIRWVYDTGDKSSSYHIPGRAAGNFTIPGSTVSIQEDLPLTGNFNILYTGEQVFEVFNTASVSSTPANEILSDGGRVIGRGKMAYWESTERYPDNRPDIWNASEYCWTGKENDPNIAWDLCGKPIRHHKFPDNDTAPVTYHFNTQTDQKSYIRIMGVEFNNIILPKDNNGQDIPGIVGYEILRGSREGNKSIVAKGMINNLRPYNIKGNQPTGQASIVGLYPNHPFNTIRTQNPSSSVNGQLNQLASFVNDPFIRSTDTNGNTVNISINVLPKNVVTFHSPDTNFRTPFLGAKELKVYGHLRGLSEQFFVEPDEHPKHKLLSDEAIIPLVIAGITEVLISMIGKKTLNYSSGGFAKQVFPQDVNIFGSGTTIGTFAPTVAGFSAQSLIFNGFLAAYSSQGFLIDLVAKIASPLAPISPYDALYIASDVVMSNQGGGVAGGQVEMNELGKGQYAPFALTLQNLLYYFSEGAELALRIIKAILPYRQYALQMQAHGFYNVFVPHNINNRQRFRIDESFYLKDNIQDMDPFLSGAGQLKYRINNLKRQNAVVIRTVNGSGANDGPEFILDATNRDRSLMTIGIARNNGYGSVNFPERRKTLPFRTTISSHYVGLKLRIQNQYGQLDSIKQVPITPCEQKFSKKLLGDNTVSIVQTGIGCVYYNEDDNPVNYQLVQRKIAKSPSFFNGDTYINRYTEKNVILFFYDWLFGQPDGTEFNYFIRQMIPEPRFWMNSEQYDVQNMYPTNWSVFGNVPQPGTGNFPKDYYKLDYVFYNYSNGNQPNLPGFIGVKEAYFYLANCSVRDFFVESDVIVDFRIDGNEDYEKAYDPYKFTDLGTMFSMDPNVITRGNYYAYDYSLSISKLFTQYFSQGNLQSRYYDPEVSSLCYTYYPDRILYSLPQQDESLKDSWFVFLANNYKEFKDQISGVKDFAKTGIFITFKNSSPLVFQGVDQLQTEFGVKITIGDGGLFSQTPQSVTLSDKEYEYGSSQNSRSVISTPAGFHYISQNQGKIFSYSQGLDEISQRGLKWWFNIFLPYKLTEDFPDYPHIDNPVAGIGCQSIYDNKNSILYFTKRDFKLKEQFKGLVTYNRRQNQFRVKDGTLKGSPIALGNPAYFQDASWTISYDPKSRFFISYHDWHPNLAIPTKNTFLTVKGNTLWTHNESCNSFCNYYGKDYPFEIELPIITGQTITTSRSMEYILECYRRSQLNCVDQYHVLDYNFDRAVVYNSEQVSGYLNLNIFPKNNVTLSLQYPQVNLNSIDILFSKEENKYRFNQFWDITKDRGEFPIGSTYPPTGPVIPGTTVLAGPYDEQNIWITSLNGYTRQLNPLNLDYDKPELQRKKFRHYLNYLSLVKTVSGDVNMIVKIVNSKNTYSPR